MATLTELKFVKPDDAGGETWTNCSPERFCRADATGPCIVASAVPALPDATIGNSCTSRLDVDGWADEFAALMEAKTTETMCSTVASESDEGELGRAVGVVVDGRSTLSQTGAARSGSCCTIGGAGVSTRLEPRRRDEAGRGGCGAFA